MRLAKVKDHLHADFTRRREAAEKSGLQRVDTRPTRALRGYIAWAPARARHNNKIPTMVNSRNEEQMLSQNVTGFLSRDAHRRPSPTRISPRREIPT